MDVLRVQAALLRANMPDLVLRLGMMLPGKVLERAGQYGILLLAGTPLSAELPDELQAGARLRPRVEEVGADRVVLRAVDPPAGLVAQAGPTAAGRRPGAARRVRGRGAGDRALQRGRGGERDPAAVALQYDSPALGTLDLRLVHQPGAGLTVTVGATAGAPGGPRPRRGGRPARGAVRGDRPPASARVVARPSKPRVDLYA